ncbi:unnamed protein product [Phytomonas sp. Hart1]|nr:unnamed protein product [Phytomonas sp. Hart1]|eukprot:CCW68261.1 unnamed protein product [Phytomonas sp. isolate Hart1]
MSSMKSQPAILMTKGIVELRTNPARLVGNILTFRHTQSRKEVTLFPLPNIASGAYFKRTFNAEVLMRQYDRILCEDGRLPFLEGTLAGYKQEFLRMCFPYFALRPVVADSEKFDGILQRDFIESRMAYEMVVEGWEPPVDPRARRGIERIATYDDGTKVAVPWGVYHIPYFRYRLQKEGYVKVNIEEVIVLNFRKVLKVIVLLGVLFSLFVIVSIVLIFF